MEKVKEINLQFNLNDEILLCFCNEKKIDLNIIKKWLIEKNIRKLSKDKYIIKVILISIEFLIKKDIFYKRIVKLTYSFCKECKKRIEEIEFEENINNIIVIIGIILLKTIFYYYKDIKLRRCKLINELLELTKNCIYIKRMELEKNNYNELHSDINNYICFIILFGIINIYLGNYDDAYIALDYIGTKYNDINRLILCLKESIKILLLIKDKSNIEDNHLFYTRKLIYYPNIIHCFIRSILSIYGINFNKLPNETIINNNNNNLKISIYKEFRLLLEECCNLNILFNNFEMNYILSRIYFEIEGNINKSIEIMEELINKCPFNNIYRIYFGRLLCFKAIKIKKENNNLELVKSILKKAILFIPNSSDLYNDLAIIYYQLGNKNKAIWNFELSIHFNPMNINTYNNLGIFFRKLGYIKESIKCYEKIIELNPNCMNSLNTIATLYNTIGNVDISLNYFKRCTNVNINISDMYNNLGVLYRDCGNFVLAKYCFLIALELNNNHLLAFQNLLYILNYFIPIKLEKIKGNLKIYNKDLIIRNILDNIQPCLNINNNKEMMICKNYNWIYNYEYYIYDEEVYNISIEWGRKFIDMNKEIKNNLDNEISIADIPNLHVSKNCMHVINIGFIGAEFFHHAVAFFTYAPIKYLSNYILKELDKEIEIKFNIFIYDNSPHHDYYTDNFKKLICLDNWRYIYEKDNIYISRLIREDKIHILFDLSGHTLNNCMSIFALKNSPIQISWIGYPNTTGLEYIDYRITDKFSDPIETKQKYSEKLIYLENSFLCYTIPQIEYPIIGNLPFNKNGYITFGSFNRLTKLHPIIIDIWCKILINVPFSHLILKSKAFNSKICQNHYYDLFNEKYGIENNRILLLPLSDSYYSHLDMYNMIDISLDTFPYAGTTTTFECIFMGVPLVTLNIENGIYSQIFDEDSEFDISSFHSQNVGRSILSNLNMHDLIASTKSEFINIATNLAKDTKKLQYYRSNLREILMKSKLCDGENFAYELAQLIVKTLKNHHNLKSFIRNE